MKKVLLFVVFAIILFSFQVRAQDLSSNKNDEGSKVVLNVEGEGKIQWNTTTFEFGKIDYMNPKTAVFEFKNTGTKPLVVTNVKAFCGCTKVDYPKTPVLPGKTGKVSAEYNAASMGNFSKSVRVQFSEESLTQHLELKGTVVRKK